MEILKWQDFEIWRWLRCFGFDASMLEAKTIEADLALPINIRHGKAQFS
jgi:hypothetical protein